jgi:hypothetical protein
MKSLIMAGDSISHDQIVAGIFAGATAQVAMMFQVTTESILQLPFFILTLFSFLNWATGGIKAVAEGRFSAIKLAKGPARWTSYVIIGVVLSNGGLLVAEMTGMPGNIGVAALTTVFVIALISEAESTLSNIEAPPLTRILWGEIISKLRRRP